MQTAHALATQLGPALDRARVLSDHIFRRVPGEALYDRPIAERHRLIFYLGHVEAFDWNQIARAIGLQSFHPAFDRLFEAGIDPPPGSLPVDVPADWPSKAEVLEYNRRVREELDRVRAEIPPQILAVAIEHRLMHVETLLYILHNETGARTVVPVPAAPPPARVMLEIPRCTATLGQRRGRDFGWDNEFEEHRVNVPPFRISKYKVTNGEYLDYVREGGERPHYWFELDGRWFLRGVFNDYPLPPDWPVYVTHRQATEYAAANGAMMASEAQFHVAAYGTPEGDERAYPWGDHAPTREHGNFDCRRYDPETVTAHPAGDSAFGVSQMVGNGWEWTSTAFAPFPGFTPFPFYPGYSANFFDGDHYVMKGAGPCTDARFLRRTFRNWFRQDYPYMHATFRLVRS